MGGRYKTSICDGRRMLTVEEVATNPWLITVVVAAVVLFLTLRLTRKEARLLLTASNSQIVGPLGGEAAGIAITHDGREIPSASSAKIVLWNDGNKTLRSSDVVPNDPLVINLKGGVKLLALVPASVSDPLSGFMPIAEHATGRDDRVALRFDHFKPGKGAAIQVVHTGTSASDLSLGGSFIDYDPPKWVPVRRNWLALVGMMLFLVVFFGPLVFLKDAEDTSHITTMVFGIVALCASYGTVFTLLYPSVGFTRMLVRRFVIRVPKDLAPFSEHVSRAR